MAVAQKTARPIRVGEAHPSRQESGESAAAFAAAAGVAAVPPQPCGGSPALPIVAARVASVGLRRRRAVAPPPSQATLVTDTDAAVRAVALLMVWKEGTRDGAERRG